MASQALADTARRLIRHIRSGVLATTLPAEGSHPATPFASLVTVAAAPDLAPLLWLSALAQHSRNLARNPRCSLLLAGPPATLNPQTAPRVTLIGTAARCEDSALLARWHALNPYAAGYAALTDFSLWRLSIEAVHAVSGFAAAARLEPALLVPDLAAVSALAAAEPAILAHCNTDHGPAMDAIATAAGGSKSGWRMAALDTDGFDLACGEELLRIDFSMPVRDPAEVRAELVRLARSARESLRA